MRHPIRLLAGLGAGVMLSCAPPVWEVPYGLPDDARVRVVAPKIGSEWEPGRLLRGTHRCWTVEVAVDHDPKAIQVVTPSELRRLQLSQASPPPDWWTVPDDDEAWIEVPPEALAQGERPACEASVRR